MESWQSGNAPDSKSGEPIYIGAQVQILYSPFYKVIVPSNNLSTIFSILLSARFLYSSIKYEYTLDVVDVSECPKRLDMISRSIFYDSR